jgi:hypothetical protein
MALLDLDVRDLDAGDVYSGNFHVDSHACPIISNAYRKQRVYLELRHRPAGLAAILVMNKYQAAVSQLLDSDTSGGVYSPKC